MWFKYKIIALAVIVGSLINLALVVAVLLISVWVSRFHPPEVKNEVIVCDENASTLQPEQIVKIMTYNVRFMAARNDKRASPEDISQTILEIARIIQEENPDIILLQEVDDGAKRTYYEDELARLLHLLPEDYACYTSAFYQKATFVPRPSIMGAIGNKLSIISKYRIEKSTRYQLPMASDKFLTQLFGTKRAILEARLPVEGYLDVIVQNTHLAVSKQGAAIKQKEITEIDERLAKLSQAAHPWILGGDFNLLPPGQFIRLREDQKSSFREETELNVLFDKYRVVPGLAEVNGDDYQQWFTKFINDPSVTEPDRTLDYIFYSNDITLTNAYVRKHDATTISDHLPLIGEFTLPQHPWQP